MSKIRSCPDITRNHQRFSRQSRGGYWEDTPRHRAWDIVIACLAIAAVFFWLAGNRW